MADEEFSVEDAESIRKKGQTYDSFLYQTLLLSTRNLSNLFRMQNTPENNHAILMEAWAIHFAISCRRTSFAYSQQFFPTQFKKVQSLAQAASDGGGNLVSSARLEYLLSIQEWLDRLTLELRRNKFTQPESGTVVVGIGAIPNPRTNKIRPNLG